MWRGGHGEGEGGHLQSERARQNIIEYTARPSEDSLAMRARSMQRQQGQLQGVPETYAEAGAGASGRLNARMKTPLVDATTTTTVVNCDERRVRGRGFEFSYAAL
jgi:hypothetical protein